jgi:DNA-binding response OmpR family regulator
MMEQTETKVRSVLVVEDEPNIARVCERIIAAEGFQVDIAVNGEVALNMWRKKDYDLCISDIRTPRMSGIELYRQLEIERPEVVNRFIFTTGDTLSGNIKTFLEETERAYLPKPFAPENLRAIVKTVFVAI